MTMTAVVRLRNLLFLLVVLTPSGLRAEPPCDIQEAAYGSTEQECADNLLQLEGVSCESTLGCGLWYYETGECYMHVETSGSFMRDGACHYHNIDQVWHAWAWCECGFHEL